MCAKIVTSFINLGIFLFNIYLASAAVNYARKESYAVEYTAGDVIDERSVVSHRHCSQLCTSSSCTAANYNPHTFQCQLLNAAVTRLTPTPGLSALFRKGTIVEGQVGMWPLNELYQGKNLVHGKTDMELYDVTFPDMSSEWMSPPVRFSGASSSYAQVTNVEDVKPSGSFAFIAAVYREQTADFPILEWSTASAYLMHIWIYQNRFFINMHCGASMFYNHTVNNNQWYTMALSYNHVTKVMSMWVDGQSEETTNGCEAVVATAQYVFLNNRLSGSNKMTGRVTCMGLYDRSMSYEDMYSSTTPHCLLD